MSIKNIISNVYFTTLHILIIAMFVGVGYNTISINNNNKILNTLWYNQTTAYQREMSRDQIRKQCISIGVKS